MNGTVKPYCRTGGYHSGAYEEFSSPGIERRVARRNSVDVSEETRNLRVTRLLHCGFLIALLLDPEDGVGFSCRNVGFTSLGLQHGLTAFRGLQ